MNGACGRLSYHDAAFRGGHLYPSGGLSDYELQNMAPPGLQFLITRMPFASTGKDADLAIARDLETQALLLADAQVDLIAFNCTAASLLLGPAPLCARIKSATGIEAITTIEAVEAALAQFKPRKIALFTPYPAEVVEAEIAHLEGLGYQVVAEGHIPCTSPIAQGQIDPRHWIDLLAATDLNGAEVLLFSCTGICLAPVLVEIEVRSQLPAVASNAALLWAILRKPNHPARPQEFGRLLSSH